MNKTQEALKMAIKISRQILRELQKHVDDMDFQAWEKINKFEQQIDTCKEALAELALQEMADNAKEIGLDYCKHGSDSACKECYMEQKSYEQSWHDTQPKSQKPAQSLQAFENDVIERCAIEADEYSWGEEIAEAIRALKGK